MGISPETSKTHRLFSGLCVFFLMRSAMRLACDGGGDGGAVGSVGKAPAEHVVGHLAGVGGYPICKY